LQGILIPGFLNFYVSYYDESHSPSLKMPYLHGNDVTSVA